MNTHKDIDFEIQFYESLLEKKDDFIQALSVLSELYTKKGRYEKGLAIDLKLSKLLPEDSLVHYNLACSYSLLNRIEDAFEAMKYAIKCGYDDYEYLMCDPDLVNLINDMRFRQYISMIKKKHAVERAPQAS